MQFGFGFDIAQPRRAGAADPIAALYGTGMEQIPLHLQPEDAVLDGSGNVTSLANKGGAGALYNATASGAGITRSGSLLNFPAGGLYLALANLANLVGTRLFFVARAAPEMDRYARFFGSQENLIRVDKNTEQFLVQRGTELPTLDGSGSPIGTALRLYEIEIAGGRIRLFVDGVARTEKPNSWIDYRINMVGAAFSGAGFLGGLGDNLTVTTDGTPARDATMRTVRRALAAKHGITLP